MNEDKQKEQDQIYAFPGTSPHNTPNCGMTKREWYAAMILQALIIEGKLLRNDAIGRSWQLADAMIEKGNK